MTDRPIIFSAPMIRALLDGRKTQTRRVLKPQPPEGATYFAWNIGDQGFFATFLHEDNSGNADMHHARIPAWIGDRLWVRESMHWTDNLRLVADDAVVDFDRMPDGFVAGRAHVSGMFMPRWASRLTLTVTDVQVQRLQDISEEDARAEGAIGDEWREDVKCYAPPGSSFESEINVFANLWNSIYGPDAWDANPWVVAMTFTVHHCNIDQLQTLEGKK